jgi:phytoene dehydrogenase-like protein
MEGHRPLTRRTFFNAGLSAALVGLTAKAERRVDGGFVHDAFPLGHRLRDHMPQFAAPARQIRIPVVIVGGGIAGLSAAWRFDKRGFRDFVLLEMEPQAGGNSRWGENEVSRFPWAAHYLPVPAKGESLVRELLEEFGVLRDGKWDERALCFAPQERLFVYGRWQEGLEPEIGATARDHAQYRQFEERIQEFRASGQFTIPMESGVRRGSPLDRMTVTQWLDQQRHDSALLRWYVDYACRDDYGASAGDTSAWAGIHYFASREPEEKGPLTWPEGNGFLVRKLLDKLARYVRTAAPVYRISADRTRLHVFTEQAEYIAEAVVFAAPTFLAPYLIEGVPKATGFEYSPWLTANLTLDRMPAQGGADPAWDNVIHNSPTLGYVDARHMSLATREDRTVWTFYWALAEHTPAQARRLLLEKDWPYWREAILNDLGRAHPDIRSCVSRIDVMRFGHAMRRPSPGFLSTAAPAGPARLFFANSDLSGFSIFEEAQYRGVQAADRALRALRLPR